MIPFIRDFPSGTSVVQTIEVPANIGVQANRFMAAGGRYRIAILADGEVHLGATVRHLGENLIVAETTSANGPELPLAVERLARQSALYLDLQ